jgi:hypothetical protein
MMTYFYAPIFVEPEESEFPGAEAPGKDTGSGVESALNEIPPSLNVLTQDNIEGRFVLSQPASVGISLPGWVTKTKAEVNTDYPGLIP